MFFYLHYILLTSGLSGTSVLLGVFFKTYSDASQQEIGILLMSFPFISLVTKPLFCSMADRQQAHKLYLIMGLFVMLIGYLPFSIIPFFPGFYEKHPRVSWYVLVIACQIGFGGLGLAWSLGDSLAMNKSQRTKTPYGRMRLMGTVSWGVYGYIIGQINEMPQLPKYVPSFFILDLSVIIEILLLLVWNNEEFKMYDAGKELQLVGVGDDTTAAESTGNAAADYQHHQLELNNNIDSTPSSIGGTLRLNAKASVALRDIFLAEDLGKRLKTCQQQQADQQADADRVSAKIRTSSLSNKLEMGLHRSSFSNSLSAAEQTADAATVARTDKNPQVLIFRMIFKEDGRLLKYLLMYTMFGLMLSPINFVFLSLEEVCRQRGYNFSQLAGAVLISQATSETLSFLVMPWFLRFNRTVLLTSGIIMAAARYIFYSGYFYESGISPYWALLGEWGHGIPYGIFQSILAELALMFANLARLFIPEMRKLGFLSEPKENGTSDKKKIEAEEASIRMALKATMQAVFSGFMDGLGAGMGCLICGLVAGAYSYIKLWQIFTIMTLGSGLLYQLVEVTRSRWSDSYRPTKGTKAYEIMSADRHCNGGGGDAGNCKRETKLATVSEKPPTTGADQGHQASNC